MAHATGPKPKPKKSLPRRAFWIVLRVAIGVYLGLCLVLYLLQSRLVFFPTREITATPESVGLAYEEVWLTAGDGVRLSAWYVPADAPRGTVLFCHGNAGNLSRRVTTAKIYHGLRMNVLLFDYRGFGKSDGRPSEQGTYLDTEAAWQHLVTQRGVAPGALIVHGRSLGGATAAHLAEAHPPRALLLESTFTSMPDMGRRFYPFLPVDLIARIHYDTLGRIAAIACPKLFIHSPEDDLVPYAQGRRLYEAAMPPKAFLEISGRHSDGFLRSGAAYVAGIDAFLERVLEPREAAAGPGGQTP